MQDNIKIAHIVAFNSDGVIGKGDDKLPWRIAEDMQHFRETTLGHAVVMGRKTYMSIGKPLPKRKNIIISRTPEYLCIDQNYTLGDPGVDAISPKTETVCSIQKAIDQAVKFAKLHRQDRIFIIGCGEIYSRTADIVDEVFATLVKGSHEGDRYYRIPNGFTQDHCQGEMSNGVETFYFKHYSRIK
jgi:dihydrofolate reductase